MQKTGHSILVTLAPARNGSAFGHGAELSPGRFQFTDPLARSLHGKCLFRNPALDSRFQNVRRQRAAVKPLKVTRHGCASAFSPSRRSSRHPQRTQTERSGARSRRAALHSGAG
jgi:hypothetical protein